MSLLDAKQLVRYIDSLVASVQALEADLAATRDKLRRAEAERDEARAFQLGRPQRAEGDPMSADDLTLGFHNRDGWMFRRDSVDGAVRIWKISFEAAYWPCTMNCPPLQKHKAECPAAADPHLVPVLAAGPHLITENEWASIVASVSAGGETAESWQAVCNFHSGNFGERAAAAVESELVQAQARIAALEQERDGWRELFHKSTENKPAQADARGREEER